MYPWYKERILVTGSTGFVGSHLVAKLKSFGAKVTAISSRNDIRNFEELSNLFRTHTFTMCYHLAALAQVETGQSSPHTTFETNITGALHMLELSRIYKVKKIILASTSHVYGENKVPYREHYTPKPTRPYETSKACIDLLAVSYARTYKLPVYIARFVNIYGPGDVNYSRLIPKTIRSVFMGNPPEVWGERIMRDYLYIDDAITAYITLGEAVNDDVDYEKIFNFGSSQRMSVKKIVELIIQYSGTSTSVNKIPDLRENEISVQYVSWAKAKRLLHWKPIVPIQEGMKRTVKWYKTHIT